MRFAAASFGGFAVFLVIALLANLTLDPLRDDAFFIGTNIGFFSLFAIWSIAAAWLIATRGRPSIGYALIGFLTFFIVMGALHNGSLRLNEPEPYSGHSTLRTIGGLYIVLLWVSLVRLTYLSSRVESNDYGVSEK